MRREICLLEGRIEFKPIRRHVAIVCLPMNRKATKKCSERELKRAADVVVVVKSDLFENM